MEIAKKAIQQQVMPNLSKFSKSTLIKKESHYELSVYNDELTKPVIVEMSVKIRQAFPSLPKEFFEIFSDRIKVNGFTDMRLKDAVNHVIDNCIYPTPTVANFISFDKRIKLYTYSEVMKIREEMGLTSDSESRKRITDFYKAVRITETQKSPVYAHVNDIEQYHFELWNSKTEKDEA